MIPALRSRTARLVAGALVLVLLSAAIRVLVQAADRQDRKAAPAAPAAVLVTTATAQQQDVPIYRTAIGTVTPQASVVVRTRIDGQLDRVGFVEGQDVRSGQMLAQLDARPIQAQLAQAQAQEAKDRAQLANARNDLQRYTQLLAEDAATRQQLDTQQALVAQLEAAVQTDAAQVQYQKVQLAYTTINAPMAGRVGARLVDPGNIVHAADAGGLVVINQIDPITAVFALPEDAVQEILHAQRAGQPLAVEALPRSGGQVLARGSLVLLNNQIDPATGTVQLKARFANAGHALWPGQYVNVRLVLGHRADAVTIPEAAVQRSQDGTFAYVVDPQRHAQARPIRLAQVQEGVAVVAQGIRAGEHVVVRGQYKLRPGVAVTESAPRAAASGAARTQEAAR